MFSSHVPNTNYLISSPVLGVDKTYWKTETSDFQKNRLQLVNGSILKLFNKLNYCNIYIFINTIKRNYFLKTS